MRCRNCNVDLPETYARCPLCNEKASTDAPVLEGIKTAEYPKVKTEPYKRNPFPFFIGIWACAVLISYILFRLGAGSVAAAFIACTPACIWTLIIRPFAVKQLYAGNFIMMNLFPFSLLSIIAEYAASGSYEKAFTHHIPVCLLAVLAALSVLILAKPKESKRAASYPVLTTPVCIAAILVILFNEGEISVLWCSALILCVCILAFLLLTRRNETLEELEAKFSLQKPVE